MKMIIALLVSVTLLFSGCVGAYNKTESKSASTSIHSKPNVHKKKYLWGIPVISVLAIGSAFLAKSCGKNNTNGKSNASVDNKPLDMAPIGEIALDNAQGIMENYLNTNLDTKGKGGKALATLDANGGEVLIIGDIHADVGIMRKLIPMINEHLAASEKNAIVVLGDMVNSRCTENDRSYEILLYFFDLYNKFPERVVLLRGNHEDAKRKINGHFNLIGWNKDGWKTKYWSEKLESCLNSIPLCCEICQNNKKYFAVHGNISTDFINNPSSIDNLEKPDIHENDPETSTEDLKRRFGLLNNHLCTENDAKPTGYYGEYINMESVAKFCQSCGYAGLFRGHDPYYPKIQLKHEGISAYTIHSNGYYPPKNPNPAQDPRVAIIKDNDTIELSYFDRQQ